MEKETIVSQEFKEKEDKVRKEVIKFKLANLQSLLSLYKLANKMKGKHSGQRNSRGFNLVNIQILDEIIYLSGYSEKKSKEIEFSNGAIGKVQTDVFDYVINAYLRDEISQTKAIDLIMYPHDIDLHVQYLGNDAIQDYWFPKEEPKEAKEDDESLVFNNSIAFGEAVSIIYVPYCGKVYEVKVDSEDLSKILEDTYQIYRHTDGSFYGKLRNPNQDYKACKGIAKLILGLRKLDIVKYKNEDSSDLRKSNLIIHSHEAKSKEVVNVNGKTVILPIKKK